VPQAKASSDSRSEPWTSARLWTPYTRTHHAVSYALLFPAFTNTNKSSLICIQDSVECTESNSSWKSWISPGRAAAGVSWCFGANT
jgi:hypothetical protein